MDINFIITFVGIFTIIAIWINFGRKAKSVSMALMLKGMAYFYLAISLFISVLNDGNPGIYATGLTLGIAIIEGTTALKSGIDKIKRG